MLHFDTLASNLFLSQKCANNCKNTWMIKNNSTRFGKLLHFLKGLISAQLSTFFLSIFNIAHDDRYLVV